MPISFDEAVRRIETAGIPLGTEPVAVGDADGRVLAGPVIAHRASPLTDVSAMDGYAVRDADIAAGWERFEIAGASYAGAGFGGMMQPGQCVRIFTGAPVPEGADRVVIQEDVVAEDGFARICAPLSSRRHVRVAGTDFRRGELLIRAGTELGPLELVAAAAADRACVEVYRRPIVRMICCGDELSPPGTVGQACDRIPESNSPGVTALVRRWGGTTTARTIVRDDLAVLRAEVANALASSDVLVIIGGASVGERDFARQAVSSAGANLIFETVAIKPGKPVWFARRGRNFVIGLAGNPTSALVTARLFLVPLIARLSGRPPRNALNWGHAQAHGRIVGCRDRDTFLRAHRIGNVLHVLQSQDSADQAALAQANSLIRVRAAPEAADVEEPIVEFIDF